MLVLWLDILNWIWPCCISTHLTFHVSRGSAATDLRWGENFNKFLFRNSLLYIAVKKLRKSVNICLSYQKIKVSRFLWPTVYILTTEIMEDSFIYRVICSFVLGESLWSRVCVGWGLRERWFKFIDLWWWHRGSMRVDWCCEWLRAVDGPLCCVAVKVLNLVWSSADLPSTSTPSSRTLVLRRIWLSAILVTSPSRCTVSSLTRSTSKTRR